jgi:hypothetical protein
LALSRVTRHAAFFTHNKSFCASCENIAAGVNTAGNSGFLMTRDHSNLIASVCLAAFGGYVTRAGANLSYISDVGPGAGFFPFWIGIGLMMFSSYQLIISFLAAPSRAPGTGQSNWHGSGRVLTGWLAMAATIFLFRWIGFAASFVLLTVFYMAVMERRPALHAFAIGAALALVFQLLFVTALGVALPMGPWGF